MTDEPANAGVAAGAETDFADKMAYGDYLRLDLILVRSGRARLRMTKCCSSSSTRPRSCG